MMFTEKEIDVLIQYIEFMENYDDDPYFRDHAISALEKLEAMKIIDKTEAR